MSPMKSSSGLDENIAGMLCYLFTFVGGIVFLAVEKRSRFVLFHALQSVTVFGIIMVGHVLSAFLPLFGPSWHRCYPCLVWWSGLLWSSPVYRGSG